MLTLLTFSLSDIITFLKFYLFLTWLLQSLVHKQLKTNQSEMKIANESLWFNNKFMVFIEFLFDISVHSINQGQHNNRIHGKNY